MANNGKNEELKKILNKALGERWQTRYAKEMGVSRSSISRAMNSGSLNWWAELILIIAKENHIIKKESNNED